MRTVDDYAELSCIAMPSKNGGYFGVRVPKRLSGDEIVKAAKAFILEHDLVPVKGNGQHVPENKKFRMAIVLRKGILYPRVYVTKDAQPG